MGNRKFIASGLLVKRVCASLITLSLCSVAVFANAKSPVWKVTKGEQSVYLGGTVHVLAQADYPLPKAFDKAYQQADVLVLEMDMKQTQTLAFQQAMLTKMTFQDGRTYEDVLRPETVSRLNNYLTERQLPIAQFKKFKPSMLSITLTMLEMQRLGIGGTGVDMYYNALGENDNKDFVFLEQGEEQVDFLAKLGAGYEDEFINYTLDDINRLGQVMSEMKQAWRTGQSKALFDLAAKDWRDTFPASYQSLIVQRNHNWIDDIESYFNSDEVELVLVGALHLVGPDGVLNMLRAKGYTIEQLP
ncbi:TraB/GumN family protein [Thalassotalea ponticola]|uniref:TraB/GumN family protein n=1 Tax=Thalassotalea ponticola TaxID=1523392 RepID=UPI0025B55082|nr:TraB/GumN family protein [Thalassotalea ponticola]MDN3653486.1 TraB/GumN family protein [Thalassotalea ponticola]